MVRSIFGVFLVIGLLNTGTIGVQAAPPTDPAGTSSSKVFFRGWEILSVSAVQRGSIVREERKNGQVSVADAPVAPRKGSYLILLIQCKPATSEPADSLWAKGSVVALRDQDGTVYPARGLLVRVGGKYRIPEMGRFARKSKNSSFLPNDVQQALVYFDVPATVKGLTAVFGGNGPSVPVGMVAEFSGGDFDLPR